jgi:hypothetical protein
MSNSNNSTCRGRADYLPKHLMLLLILVGNVLLIALLARIWWTLGNIHLSNGDESSVCYVQCIISFLTDMIFAELDNTSSTSCV